MLHLIFKSPLDLAVLERMATGDAAVFLESAVFCGLRKGQLADALKSRLDRNRFFVLHDDMATRGITEAEILPGLVVIDYPGLVKLTSEHSPIQSWC